MNFYIKLISVCGFVLCVSATAMDNKLEELRNAALRVVVQEGHLDPAVLGSNLAEDLSALDARAQGSIHMTSHKQLGESVRGGRKSCLVFSPCGRFCAFGNGEKISLYDSFTGKLIRSLESPEGHDASIDCLAFSPDGRLLVSASSLNNKMICEWDIATGNLLQSFVNHGPTHYFQAFSPDCQSVALRGGFGNGHQGIWNFKTDAIIHCEGGSCLAAFHPHGKLVAFDEENDIVIWDIATRKAIKRLRDYWVSGVVFSHNGSMMAGANYKGTVYIWNTENWKLKHTLKLDANQYLNIAFSCNDHYLAVGGAQGTAIYDVKTGDLLNTIPHEGRQSMETIIYNGKKTGIYGHINTLAFNGCGQLGTVSYNGDVRIWNLLPEDVCQALRSLPFNQLLILMSLVRPLAAGRIVHLTPGSNAWNLVNQMPRPIKDLLSPCLEPAPVGRVQGIVDTVANFVDQHALSLSFVAGVAAVAVFQLLKK